MGGRRSWAVHVGLLILALGCLGAMGETTTTRLRLFAQPSQSCSRPYLTTDAMRSTTDDGRGCANAGPLRSTGWAHLDLTGSSARGSGIVWFEVLADHLPLTIDAAGPLSGVVTLQSSFTSAYLSSGNLDLYLWVEADGWRFGGAAADDTLDPVRVTGDTTLAVEIDIPDALHATTVGALRLGVEVAGTGFGMVGVMGQGQTWFDLPVAPGRPGDSTTTCPRDPRLTGAGVLDLPLPGELDANTFTDYLEFVFSIEYDLRTRGEGPHQLDVYGNWDSPASKDETDLNLHLGGLNSSILQQPFEPGSEYLPVVLPACGTLEVRISRPVQPGYVMPATFTLELVEGTAEWPEVITHNPDVVPLRTSDLSTRADRGE